VSRTSDEPGRLGDQADPPPAKPETPPYHKEDERQPGLLAVVRETVVLVVLAVLLAVVFKTFLVAAFYIPSGSMESTLNISDRVLVEKVSYRFGDIERGDVIVFVHDEPGAEPASPSNPVTGFFSSLGQAIGVVPPSDRDFIKRVIGLPGDTITCDGKVIRNGKRLDEQYLDPGVTTTGCGARPGRRLIARTTLPPDSSTTAAFGVPARRVSYAACSPLSPTMSPTRYGAPNCLSRSAVISPTDPISCAPRRLLAPRTSRPRWKNTPSTGKSLG